MGELIFQTSQAASSDPRITVFLISSIAFIATIVIFITQFKKQHLCYWILPLNICLGGAVFLRKDFLCLLSVIAILTIFSNLKSNTARNILISLILVIGINLHECVFFIIVPFITLLTWCSSKDGKSKIPRLIWISIPYISFLLVTLFKGDANTAKSIHDSWQIAAMGDTPASTIASLGWDTVNIIMFHIRVNYLTPSYGVYGIISKPIVWAITFLLIPNILFLNQTDSHTDLLSKKTCILKSAYFPIYQFTSYVADFKLLFIKNHVLLDIFGYCHLLVHSLALPQFHFPSMVWAHLRKKIAPIVYNAKSRIISIVFLPIICISPYFTSLDKAFECSCIGSYFSLYRNIFTLIKLLVGIME